MKLAVIPARGGSKRIPRKNIKQFCGKPIIVWSIEAARSSGCFDEILVSTDDEEIAHLAKTNGAEVPFLRPPELCDDYTGVIPVVDHAIRWQQRHDKLPTEVCCILATAPFLLAEDIQRGLNSLLLNGADYAFSVTKYAFPIQRAVRINPFNRVEMFNPEHYHHRSQDLEEAYHDAAQFYWGRTAAWLTAIPVFSTNAVPVILPSYRVQDIDDPEDWIRAELVFNSNRN